MKSHELTLIRAEGLESKSLQFFIYLNESCYGIIELSTNASKSIVLPSSGQLGLKVCEQGSLIGEIFVSILSLEQNGLQWLPILETSSNALHELPEEVPSPRVLISLYSSKTKVPGKPIEPPSYIKTSAKPEAVFEDCDLVEDIESFDESKIEKTENFSEMAEIRLEKSGETDKNSSNPHKDSKTCSIDLEELVESLNYDLTKSQKKNYEKNRLIRELKIQLASLSKSFQSFHQQESCSKLEVAEVAEALKYQERIHDLEDIIEGQAFKMQDLSDSVLALRATVADKEEIVKDQELLIEEQDSIIKELESSQAEFESILSQKEVEAELSKSSLKETVKSLELRLKESVMALDILESSFKDTTSRAVQLEVSLFDLQKKNEQDLEALKSSQPPHGLSQPCPGCEKFQIEIKGHSENTKRLYQTIQAVTDKLNTSEFHNQELLISTQDLQQELDSCKALGQALLCNSLPQDETDALFQALHPAQFCKSVKLAPSVYLISGKKVKLCKSADRLAFLQDSREVFFAEAEAKHEKNSLSLEDISNQIENYKSQNLIHSRVTSRENKLRVLTKQW